MKKEPLVDGCGCGVEPDFEGVGGGTLCVTVGVMFKKDLKPTWKTVLAQRNENNL